MASYTNFIGIDIGKFSFFVAIHGSKTTNEYENSNSGIKRFIAEYKDKLKTSLSILETTGGYEARLIKTLYMKKYATHRANTRKVKSFICSHGNSAKTDKLDAKALARYGFERHHLLELYTPPAQNLQDLYELVSRRRELKQILVAEKNRLQAPGNNMAQSSGRSLIEHLEGQIEVLTDKINELISKDQNLRAKKEVLKALPGVGDVVASELLILMPELGSMGGRQAASLSGVAPRSNDSGRYRGYRSVAKGRNIIKPILFLAAMSARNSNSDLKDFYEQLIARGKKKMVALTALMRKIVVRANAKLRDLAAKDVLQEHKEIKIAA